ncbi:MAG: BON domain-containing protein [Bdellovibrionales bacterium]|nr:BON domain-containing protein [Bdellovibrionales bacterium]
MKTKSVHLAPLALVLAGLAYFVAAPPSTLGLDLAGSRTNHDRASDLAASSGMRQDARTSELIRNALRDDASLSDHAKQVKVDTNHGVVSLRGKVADPSEKAAVEKIARDVARADRVENHLKVIQ